MSEFSILVVHQPLIAPSDPQDTSLESWLRLDGHALVVTATIHVRAVEIGPTTMTSLTSLTSLGGRPAALAGAPVTQFEPDELERVEATLRTMTGHDDGRAVPLADCVNAVLLNGLGLYNDARVAAESACAQHDPDVRVVALTELIESGVRSGKRSIAVSAMQQLEDQRTHEAAPAWEVGCRARSRALLAGELDAERHHREALEVLGVCRSGLQLARGHLVYGEWLRRQSRRVDARVHLGAAAEMFTESGLSGYAERARRELAATSLTARKRSAQSRYDLTPQEAEIARLASDGRTNSEIGGELFISSRTVEWHLRKVFAKLGVSSRRQLRLALPGAVRSTATA